MASVFDLYVQLGSDHWLSQHLPERAHRSDASDVERIAGELTAMGHRLVGAAILPYPSPRSLDYTSENQIVRDAAVASQAKSVPLVPIYAVQPGNDTCRAWLSAALSDGPAAAGIKLWPYMGGFSLDALREDAGLLELVREHRLIVFMHVGTGREIRSRSAFPPVAADPATAVQVARALPDVTFVVSHLLRLSSAALHDVRELQNLYLDVSGLSSLGVWREGDRDGLPADDAGELAARSPGQILTHLARSGLAGRLLYGSNWPYCTWWGSGPGREIEIVMKAEIDVAEQQAILAGNAMALLQGRGLARGLS